MAPAQLDNEKTRAFQEKMAGILNSAGLALLISVGYRTGLFDTMAKLPPATSQEIAAAAGLSERYVREWLAGMVVGRIVQYDPARGAYQLPPEHAVSLARSSGPNNLSSFAQYISLMGNVEEDLIECFRHGGGVPYSAFGRFQAIEADRSALLHDTELVETILPIVPGLVERLRAGIAVADIGCGRGHAINLMAAAFPNSRFTGYDFSEEGIHGGQEEAAELGLSNVRFVVQDVATLDAREQFDFISVFDAVHDQAHPAEVLSCIDKALRSEGVLLMVDVAASSKLQENMDHPMGPALYMASCFHCMTVSLAQGGDGLGTMWGEQKALEMLAQAGFKQIEVKQVESDRQNNYYIAQKA